MPPSPTTSGARANCLTHAAICALDIPPRGYLLEPALPAPGMTLLHAARGVGKTLLAMGMAHAVATGRDFLGWRTPRARPALYIDGEMPLSSMGERCRALWPRTSDLRILTPDKLKGAVPDLSTYEGRSFVEELLGDAALLVLDNLSCLFRTGKENDSESWGAAQHWLISLRSRGVTVLMVHHQGKSGAQRGTSKREDVVDTIIALSRPQNYRMTQNARFEVHFAKDREGRGEDVRPFEVRYSTPGGKAEWEVSEGAADPRMAQIAPLRAAGMALAKIAEETGIPKSTVAKLLKKAQSDEW